MMLPKKKILTPYTKSKLSSKSDDEEPQSIAQMLSLMYQIMNESKKTTQRMMEQQKLIKESHIMYKQDQKMLKQALNLIKQDHRLLLKQNINSQQDKSLQKKLSKQHGMQEITHSYETRFKSIDVPVPLCLSQNKQLRWQTLLQWMGEALKRVFSYAFQNFKLGQLDEKKTKVFCSENIIRNLIRLVKIHPISAQQMRLLDKALQQDLLPYFKQKYPESEQSQVNSQFQNLLIQRDLMNQNEFDYVYKSKIIFGFKQSANYNKQIMNFINFLVKTIYDTPSINALAEMMGLAKSKNESMKKTFIAEMQKFFKLVQNQEQMFNLINYNLKQEKTQIKNTVNSQNNSKNVKTQSEKQKYRQKVQSYTNYLIGHKLAETTEVFKQYELDSENIKLTSSALMRIITKWCQQLEKCFDQKQILKRETPFRMRNGDQNYMQAKKLQYLNFLLQKEKKQSLNKMLDQISKNNYSHQSEQLQTQCISTLKMYSQQEASVGQFSSFTFKNNKTYLIKYLNLLIHSINKAVKNFYNYEYCQRNDALKIQDSHLSNQEILKNVQINRKKTGSYHQPSLSLIPQLITFRIGDLLRCKCSSKDTEVIALYKQAEKLSRQKPGDFRIIRVKNRLSKGNKDILMNILYKNTVIVEMQLAIKQEKSKFIESSNKFNHYIYQLQRAKFGAIMEMCSVWMSQDLRSQFFANKIEKLNTKATNRKQFEVKNCCYSSQINVSLPFVCEFCKYHYSQSGLDNYHTFCDSCNKFLCFQCRFSSYKSVEEKLTLLPQLKQNQYFSKQNLQFTQKIPNTGGLIINFGSTHKKILPFYSVKQDNKYFIFQHDEQHNKIKQIAEFKSNKFSAEFLKQNLVCTSDIIQKQLLQVQLKSSHQIQQQIISNQQQALKLTNMLFKQKIMQQTQSLHNKLRRLQSQKLNIDIKQEIHKYFVIKYLKQSKKSQKASISVVNWNIKPELLNVQKIDSWPSVKKINFSGNSEFQQIQMLVSKFPNVQLALLNQIGLSKFPKISWKNITHLYLSHNKIQKIEGLENYSNLQLLDLSYNKIQQIPQNIKMMTSLTRLCLNNNNILKLPCEIKYLKSLNHLNMDSNLQLSKIPEQIGQLTTLQQLYMQKCGIQQVPQKFGNLFLLRQLMLSQNKIKQFSGEIMKNLENLQKLSIFNNKLTQLSQYVGNLTKLKQLYINDNSLQIIPQSIGRLKKLKLLFLYNNKISNLPSSIGNLSQLRKLSVFNNQLKQLPQQISNLRSLRQLNLSFNHLTQVSDKIFKNMPNLLKLFIQSNNLSYLPSVKQGKLSSLRQIYLDNNQFKQIPLNFVQNLSQLVRLSISNNKIEDLSKSTIQKLCKKSINQSQTSSKFQQLYIDGNNIKNIQLQILQPLSFIKVDKNIIKNSKNSQKASKIIEMYNLHGCKIQIV